MFTSTPCTRTNGVDHIIIIIIIIIIITIAENLVFSDFSSSERKLSYSDLTLFFALYRREFP